MGSEGYSTADADAAATFHAIESFPEFSSPMLSSLQLMSVATSSPAAGACNLFSAPIDDVSAAASLFVAAAAGKNSNYGSEPTLLQLAASHMAAATASRSADHAEMHTMLMHNSSSSASTPLMNFLAEDPPYTALIPSTLSTTPSSAKLSGTSMINVTNSSILQLQPLEPGTLNQKRRHHGQRRRHLDDVPLVLPIKSSPSSDLNGSNRVPFTLQLNDPFGTNQDSKLSTRGVHVSGGSASTCTAEDIDDIMQLTEVEQDNLLQLQDDSDTTRCAAGLQDCIDEQEHRVNMLLGDELDALNHPHGYGNQQFTGGAVAASLQQLHGAGQLDTKDISSREMSHGGKAGKKGPPAKNLMAERRRRKKLNDRLYTLRSVVPKITKMDRASILGDAIEYLKELLQRINDLHEELEATAPLLTDHNSGGAAAAASPAVNVNALQQASTGASCFNVMLNPPLTPASPAAKECTNMDPNQPPKVEVRTREGRALNIHMFCGRQPGLLLATMRALDGLGLDVQQAVISCFNGFALDVFRAEQTQERDVAPEEIKRLLLLTAAAGAASSSSASHMQ